MTIRDQLTDSLCDLHQVWSTLELCGVCENAIRQLCHVAANHFKLVYQIHSLPYITRDYAHEKLFLINHVSTKENIFNIITTPNMRDAMRQNTEYSANSTRNTHESIDMTQESSNNFNF